MEDKPEGLPAEVDTGNVRLGKPMGNLNGKGSDQTPQARRCSLS